MIKLDIPLIKLNGKPFTPVIKAEPHKDSLGGLRFYCPFCLRYHHHGTGEGHRVAHCSNPYSPFLRTGYILKLKPRDRSAQCDKWEPEVPA